MTTYRSFTFYLLYVLRQHDNPEGNLVRMAFANRMWDGRMSGFRRLYEESHPELVQHVIERFHAQKNG